MCLENGSGAPADIEMQVNASLSQLCTIINIQTGCYPHFNFSLWINVPSPHGPQRVARASL